MIIDCQECAGYESESCEDCFVMAVLSHRPGSPLEIDSDQQTAIKSLQEAGLAPVLKFKRKAG